jgi:hypothetical protein
MSLPQLEYHVLEDGMRIVTLLNQIYHFPGFIYKSATLSPQL